jgi:methyl-accepting chemotaxis protein
MKNRLLGLKMLAVGIPTLLAAVLIVGVYHINKARNSAIEEGQWRSARIAQSLSHMTEATLKESIRTTSQLASGNAVMNAAVTHAGGVKAGPEIDRAVAALTTFVEHNQNAYERIVIAGTDGKVFADATGGRHKDTDTSREDHFKTAMAGRATAGAVSRSEVTGNIVLKIGAPVYSPSKEIVGVLAMTVNMSSLMERLNGVTLGKTGHAYMVDKSGVVIAHPRKDFLLNLKVTEGGGMEKLAKRMVAGEAGTEEYTFNGVRMAAGFAPVPSARWSVCVAQDYDELTAPANRLAMTATAVAMLFLILAAGGLLFLYRRMSRAIDQIARDMDHAQRRTAPVSSQAAPALIRPSEGATGRASSREKRASLPSEGIRSILKAEDMRRDAEDFVQRVEHQISEIAWAFGKGNPTGEKK